MEVTPQAVRVVLAVAVVGFVWRAFEVTEKIDRGGGALALGGCHFISININQMEDGFNMRDECD